MQNLQSNWIPGGEAHVRQKLSADSSYPILQSLKVKTLYPAYVIAGSNQEISW